MVITLGWLIVGFFALLVGMAMGEICSAYPTAGGLYYWSAKLARKNGPRWAWFTGWFNLLGQIGVIASVDYALAVFIAYFIRMFDDGFRVTVLTIFGIFVLVLIAHGLLNTFGVRVVRVLGDVSVWWHVVGVVIIFLVLLIAPDNTRGLGSVFDQDHGALLRSAVLAVLADLGRRQPDQRRRRRDVLLQAEQLQLHRPADSARRVGVRAVLAVLRPQMVHRPEGAGHAGGAAGDRARAGRSGAGPPLSNGTVLRTGPFGPV